MLASDKEVDMDSVPRWMRSEFMYTNFGSGTGEAVKVLADDRLNAVVATGSIAALNAAEQLVRQLDVPSDGGNGRRIRVLEVVNADASELAETLDELFASSDDG